MSITKEQQQAIEEASIIASRKVYTKRAYNPDHEDYINIILYEKAFSEGMQEVLNSPEKYGLTKIKTPFEPWQD